MKLVIKGSGAEFALDKPELVLGRGAEVDIAVPDLQASRHHAKIRLVGEQPSITDLGSTNGTFVNGKPVSGVQTLHVGDEIRIGDIVFSLQEGLAQAEAFEPIHEFGGWGDLPATGRGGKLVWALAGIGVLIVVVIVGLLAWRGGRWPDSGRGATGDQTATAQAALELANSPTPTYPPVVVEPTAAPQPGSEAALPTLTVRPTLIGSGKAPSSQSVTPSPQSPPFNVSWSPGRYEGWAEGRRMSSDLVVENISFPEIAPPYEPYFIVSDLNGAMRVGELQDYSRPNNRLPTLPPGQRVTWTWFTTMSNQEWVRGSVFRYGGWSWAQEFYPDGSLKDMPRVISDQQIIPFLPVQLSLEQLATAFPKVAPSFVPPPAPE